jgi:zinc protease
MIGNYILGGSFNSRLMTEIRQAQGLTYSIRSSHMGDVLTPGHWVLMASFSPALLNKGIEATNSVLNQWYTEGVTKKEVDAAIQTLTGSYLVGLSTTGRVAAQVHSFLQRGMDVEYVDQYPLDLRKITSKDVNRAIKQYMDPSKAKLVAAGSLENTSAPAATQFQTVRVGIDTPHAGWKIQIDKIYRTADSLLVVSKLSNTAELAAQVITTVSDSADIPADIDLPVRHYVLGKTWNWGDTGSYTFIDSIDALGTELDGAELLYSN